MQFLKTLFWVALAVILVLFSSVNWTPVTIKLWGGLEADVKLPALVLFSFLLGFIPMLIVHNARLWTLKRRLDAHERQAAAIAHVTPAPPTPAPHAPEDRIATDQKVWPA
jgi:lipopolysaccharide assembly protein A